VDLAILMCPAPQSPDWELPLRDPAACILLGWVIQPEGFDAGAPLPVRSLLSQVLCRIATVSYLAHDGMPVPKCPHKIVTTREPALVTALFVDPAYPWNQHGQAAFLSDDRVPQVSSRLLTDVVGQQKVEAAERAGFKGVMLPGVDGAVAGLWMFSGTETFTQAMEECCANVGAELHLLTEDEFRSAH